MRMTLKGLAQSAAALTVLLSVVTLLPVEHHALQLFTHFRLQYLGASILLLVLLAAWRAPRYAVALCAAAVLNASFVLPWYLDQPPGAGGTEVKVMLANVLASNDDPTPLLALIEAEQPKLIRNTILLGLGAFALAFGFFGTFANTSIAFLLGAAAGGGVGYWWFNEKRETIYVRDLIHGRYFSCPSVIELARKEAWLGVVTSFLRQVMESAKHWDGTETQDIAALPKAEAKLVMLKGL